VLNPPKKRKIQHPEARPLKSDEQVQNENPQDLHYFIMAAEGLPKPPIPPSTKKLTKSPQNRGITEARGPKRPARGLKKSRHETGHGIVVPRSPGHGIVVSRTCQCSGLLGIQLYIDIYNIIYTTSI